MKNRVVSGYRPSGRLHLGHYHGNLKNMIRLQDERDCYFFVADWHALTTEYRDTSMLGTWTEEMVLDWLAAGMDPDRCTIYRQSDIRGIPELVLYLGMIVTLGELERNPTYKEQLRELDSRVVNTYGFLGYPVLMATDILAVDAELVPVGEDQLPHLELTREIARSFNSLYEPVFPEPQPVLSRAPKIPGTDGRKMSKSYNNYIGLEDSAEVIGKKVRKMITDPARKRRDDKGHPEVCTVFSLYPIYFPDDVERVAAECKDALIGCTDCKDRIAQAIACDLAPFRKRRSELVEKPDVVREILARGANVVNPIVDESLARAKRAMKIGNPHFGGDL
ncbi:MAG: tryptophan--tRNA ligase [Candidatus Anoxymicrobium japonicum]|uniref:Tryptophan--tRNA ligase n=1 Tax=Candidatus Anoxymicrobium japonicum TaxID=2013648 RepID=A0A2N3G5X7_9ACTN|nr:MAG: tryptophan--tRNA ligase [Candidatus Anoxymicrobium japonicum]